MRRETIPIFYEIELSDLKDQRNSLEKSFFEPQWNGVDCETIQKWKLALKEVGRSKGFVTAKIHNGHHSKLKDELIPIVQQKPKKGRPLSTPNVQALGLTFDKGSDDCFTSEEFGELLNLRFLNLDRANMRGNFTSLLLELRWLPWRGCHKSSKPLVLNLENLVILDLSWSAMADDWEGWAQIMEKANKLKVLELIGCGQLCRMPSFPPGSKLQRLILERCSHLSLIDKSIGNLKYLRSLNIKSTPIVLLPEELG
ncbi:hypothetical protein NL676_008061 [Syzygium grande]|nr:hypothetical protein NL676_008061 [Syzygium grande]